MNKDDLKELAVIIAGTNKDKSESSSDRRFYDNLFRIAATAALACGVWLLNGQTEANKDIAVIQEKITEQAKSGENILEQVHGLAQDFKSFSREDRFTDSHDTQKMNLALSPMKSDITQIKVELNDRAKYLDKYGDMLNTHDRRIDILSNTQSDIKKILRKVVDTPNLVLTD